ncbi:MAG: biotin synthase BioB [Deltaproteobacteria bacterium]|nr:biotin synthase BioB [Deltaproteobacteria bacterium]
MDYALLADKALNNQPLTHEECLRVLQTPEDSILMLLQSAYAVRKTFFGKKVYLHMLLNVKSGLCSEDCSYCSQSKVSQAKIEKYPLLDETDILKGAYAAREARARRYCIVSSGRAPSQNELDTLRSAVKKIKKEIGIDVCTSLGFLTEEKALALKEAGVNRYNHNLNASEHFYPNICSSHTFQDRVQTVRYAQAAGLELCCGALFGMGESDEDIIDTLMALKDIEPDSLPINFFNPIAGTPLEHVNYLTPLKCLNILCLARFLNPRTEIRPAGGREYHIRSLQPFVLFPANSLFVAGYLTTTGQTPEDAWKMIEDMGFEVEEERSMEVSTRAVEV